MAGDWMQIDLDLPEKAEVLRLASDTGLGVEAVVGRLVAFWRWVERNGVDGLIRHATPAVVGRVVNADLKFVETLEAVGWLKFTDDGAEIPGWEKRFTRAAKQRMATAARVIKHRALHQRYNGVSKALTKEEKSKRKEEVKSTPPVSPPTLDLPPVLDSPEFRSVLDKWRAYKGRAYKARGLQSLISQAAKRAEQFGLATVVNAFERAMGNNHEGWNFESNFRELTNGRQRTIGGGQRHDPASETRPPGQFA